MGYDNYDTDRRASYSNSIADKAPDQIFKTFTSKKEFHGKSSMKPENLGIREARDSEEHPNSLPIIIALDVTGSMGKIPEKIIKNDLSIVMNTLIHHDIKDVQIMFLAIGDHTGDSAPLQVGQFESSDELMHKWLEDAWLEGWGQGNRKESYNLAWLVAGWHTVTDAWIKRKQKGFIFTIGDEAGFDAIDPQAITAITGTKGEEWTAKAMLEKASQMYHVYHIHANDGSYPNYAPIIDWWKDLMGENFSIVESYHDIAEKIASIIAANLTGKTEEEIAVVDAEGTVDTEDNRPML